MTTKRLWLCAAIGVGGLLLGACAEDSASRSSTAATQAPNTGPTGQEGAAAPKSSDSKLATDPNAPASTGGSGSAGSSTGGSGSDNSMTGSTMGNQTGTRSGSSTDPSTGSGTSYPSSSPQKSTSPGTTGNPTPPPSGN